MNAKTVGHVFIFHCIVENLCDSDEYIFNIQNVVISGMFAVYNCKNDSFHNYLLQSSSITRQPLP
jgi:hypothetical protein